MASFQVIYVVVGLSTSGNFIDMYEESTYDQAVSRINTTKTYARYFKIEKRFKK